MPTPAPLPRRVLVSHAPPHAFQPMARAILARLGYAILEPEAFALQDPDDRPDAFVVDERLLAEVPDDGGPPIPIVAITGRQGVMGADPRILGAVPRPAGLHELYRVLQQVLEETPRSSPRVATHLPARCRIPDAPAWKATLLMLSENGCLLRTPAPLLLGQKLRLRFELPRSGSLELEAEVAYQLLPDLGLVFSAVAPAARRAIAGFVSEALASL